MNVQVVYLVVTWGHLYRKLLRHTIPHHTTICHILGYLHGIGTILPRPLVVDTFFGPLEIVKLDAPDPVKALYSGIDLTVGILAFLYHSLRHLYLSYLLVYSSPIILIFSNLVLLSLA